ncbi:hypothetical protein EDB80DRAFT_821527, partial [Ilyonectria destructans]
RRIRQAITNIYSQISGTGFLLTPKSLIPHSDSQFHHTKAYLLLLFPTCTMAPRSKRDSRRNAAESNKNRKPKNDARSESTCNDDGIWEHAGVTKLKFYATVSLFEDTIGTCDWVIQTEMDKANGWLQPQHHEQSKTPEGQLLDQVALLFARAKNLKRGEGRDNCAASTAVNVTATSMIKDAEEKTLTVFIAKNGGPQEFDGVGDEDFATNLEEWHNGLGATGLPANPRQDEMWETLQEFWYRRHRYYIYEIQQQSSRWTKDAGCIDLQGDNPHAGIMKALHDNPRPRQQFERDLAHVQKLLGWVAEAEEGGSVLNDQRVRNAFVNRICFEDDETWGSLILNWSMIQGSSASDLVSENLEHFCRTVKYFKLLKTCLAVWRCFSSFPGWNISFEFLPKPPRDKISKHELAKQVRELFKDNSSNINPKIKDAMVRLKGRFNRTHIHRSLHAEIQLLQDHIQPKTQVSEHDTRNLHPYFGCSKLACFFCWEVTRSLGFSMRNTHGKVFPGCAFPLQSGPDNAGPRVASCLTDAYSRIDAKIWKWDGESIPLISNTEPAYSGIPGPTAIGSSRVGAEATGLGEDNYEDPRNDNEEDSAEDSWDLWDLDE